MATLKNSLTGGIVLVNAQHVVGRNPQIAHTHLPEIDISQSHATVFWLNGHWHLRDHSRNGTMVNEKYVLRGTCKLNRGDRIQFGREKSACWTLSGEGPPASYLQSVLEPTKVLALTAIPGIPNPDDPAYSFYYSRENVWQAEYKGDPIDLTHGKVLSLQGEEWMFIENEQLEVTINYAEESEQAYFQFTLSADEERIGIKIVVNELELDMGERVYHYLLLALARERLAHAEQDYVFDDQGWMSIEAITHDLSKEFRKDIDAYYLNLQIYRLRKQLLELEPLGFLFSNIIERRKGEIRFAFKYFRILKENICIGELLPASRKDQQTLPADLQRNLQLN